MVRKTVQAATEDGSPIVVPFAYEQRLSADARWALAEGSDYFQDKGSVRGTLRRITRRLDELNIPYALVGGLALFEHGYRRFTDDVDLLVTEDGLRKIHESLEGLGYVPPFPGSKQLRDADSGVRIEFLIAGKFPGDGKPKPVAFPDPTGNVTEINGLYVLQLPRLIDLKLASGMTNTGRLKDLADVQELIKALALPRNFKDKLNPFVREEFDELWSAAQTPQPE